MKNKIKVAQFGLGPIGIECLKSLASQDWARVVGAVEIDPHKLDHFSSIFRSKSLRKLRAVISYEQLAEQPDLVFHTAVSNVRAACEQLLPIVRRGICVVASC